MYIINDKMLIKERNTLILKICLIITFFIISIFLFINSDIKNLEFTNINMNYFITVFSIISLIIFCIVIKKVLFPIILKLKKISNKLKNYRYLESNGTLLKNVPCEIKKKIKLYREESIIYSVKTQYTMPDGKVLSIEQDIKGNFNLINERKVIDILIDLENYDRYYMNFDIEEY